MELKTLTHNPTTGTFTATMTDDAGAEFSGTVQAAALASYGQFQGAVLAALGALFRNRDVETARRGDESERWLEQVQAALDAGRKAAAAGTVTQRLSESALPSR